MQINQIELYKLIKADKFDREFTSSAICMVEMYLRAIIKLKVHTKALRKLNVYVGEKFDNNIKAVGILSIYLPFNFDNYNSQDRYGKKKIILDLVHDALMNIANEQEIDTDKLYQAYQYCIDSKLNNKWILTNKFYRSPNKQYYGAIECDWEVDFLSTTAIIYDSEKTELFRKEVFKITFDQPIGYLPYIYEQKPYWNENNQFLFKLSGAFLKDLPQRVWNINVPEV